MDKITLMHGEGGLASSTLIKDLFYKNYGNDILKRDLDGATLEASPRIAFTTDSFVVKPLFFNGGNIGTLAVNGTVNDLVVSGAIPKYLSCSFIIEEGFEIEKLELISKAISKACEKANVKIVTGDTKVVSRGEADGIYINTAGIGFYETDYVVKELEVTDQVIVTGNIASHGTVILNERYQLHALKDFPSDSAPLTPYISIISEYSKKIKIMKDPTRGGVGSILNEIATNFKVDIEIDEIKIPIALPVFGVNQLLGIDPLYVASEGIMVVIIKKEVSDEFLDKLQIIDPLACIIGEVKNKSIYPNVIMKTQIGGKRLIPPLEHTILPRIC